MANLARVRFAIVVATHYVPTKEHYPEIYAIVL